MKGPDVERLMSLLGVWEVKRRGEWVNGSCPFATWRHAKGRDKKPSFGIQVRDSGTSRARCLACGVSCDLPSLVWAVARRRGYGPWSQHACRLLTKESLSMAQIEERLAFADNPEVMKTTLVAASFWKGTKTAMSRMHKHEVKKVQLSKLNWPLLDVQRLDALEPLPPEAMAYLRSERRKLSAWTIELWDLRWNPRSQRIALPIRDWKGQLVGISGRALDNSSEEDGETVWRPAQKPKFLHNRGFTRDFFLFGEHLVARDDVGYLVEGHFDAIYLRQMGYGNAVAVMGSHLSGIQAAKAADMFSEVVIFPDGDDAGGKAALRWEATLKDKVRVAIADCLPGRDPDDCDADDLADLLSVDNLTFTH